MPGKNKYPLLATHAPPELAEWVRAEAVRRGVTVTTILNEAIAEKRAHAACDPDAVPVNLRDLELVLGYVNVSPLPVSARNCLLAIQAAKDKREQS